MGHWFNCHSLANLSILILAFFLKSPLRMLFSFLAIAHYILLVYATMLIGAYIDHKKEP